MSSQHALANDTAFSRRPVGYFVHHHGHGHAKRCLAIAHQLNPRPMTIFCAKPEIFPNLPDNAEVIQIPDFHGKQSRSEQLHDQPTCLALDCAPVGVSAIRGTGGIIAAWFAREDPALFVVDVSAELALLGRICSVPVVKIRMHGDRDDSAHQAAYSACTAMLAPYNELLEQADWPDHLRKRTFYTGGLIDMREEVPTKAQARQRLGLSEEQQIFAVVAGNGGVGIPIAPVTLAARAYPDALWLTVGKTVRYGHETDFSNLVDIGWVDNVNDYLAAADVVVATPGDTLTHEIARIGRPLICIPEWCYYDEQACKARALAAKNLAVYSPTWPASFSQWRALVDEAGQCDIPRQRQLVDERAANRAAGYLEGLIQELWLHSAPDELTQERYTNVYQAGAPGTRCLDYGEVTEPQSDPIAAGEQHD